jgi:hypothetical protein
MKKRHFYHGRIRVLSMCICFLVCGLLVTSVANAQGGAQTKLLNIGKAGGLGAALAFAPFALVKQMKDDKKWDDLDQPTKDYIEALEKQLNVAFEASLKGVVKTKELEDLEKKLGPQLTTEEKAELATMVQTVKDQAILVQQLKDAGIGKVSDSLAATLKENADKIKGFKKAGSTAKLEFELSSKFLATKAIAEQAATDIATHTIGLRVPGIGQIPTRQPFLRDLFTVVNTNLEYIKYIDQETVVRDAKNVASATASSHTSKITWKERSIQITNIRDMIDVPIDMMEDYDFVEGEVRRLLDVNVQLRVDAGLLSDDGIHPNLHSIDEKASEFDAANTLGGTIDPWTGTVKDPNIFDLVIAMTSQIIALGQDGAYMPNVVLFNSIDRYKALLIKDANGQYIMPPFVTRVGGRDYNIDGMIVRSNPGVPKNSIRVFDSTHGTIYSRKTAVMQVSYENNNNFETEVATLKVYERLNFLIRNTGANAFMKCSDVATALVALKAGV